MDKIESLRGVFSKASIVVSNSWVSAMYTTKPGLIIQELTGDKLDFFRAFLISCDAMRMKSIAGKSFSIRFDAKIQSDAMTFFQPIDENITIDGLIASLVDDDITPSEDFIEFAFRSKLQWQDGVEDFIDSVMKKTSETRSQQQIDSAIGKWEKLSDAVNGLLELVPLSELDFSEPDAYSDGFIEFVITGKMKNGILFDKDAIRALYDALGFSSNLSFEISVDDGETEVTLFP